MNTCDSDYDDDFFAENRSNFIDEIEMYHEIIKIVPRVEKTLQKSSSTVSLKNLIDSNNELQKLKIVKKTPIQIRGDYYSFFFSNYHEIILDFIDNLNNTVSYELNIDYKCRSNLMFLIFEITPDFKYLQKKLSLLKYHKLKVGSTKLIKTTEFKRWVIKNDLEIEDMYYELCLFCEEYFDDTLCKNVFVEFLWNSYCVNN